MRFFVTRHATRLAFLLPIFSLFLAASPALAQDVGVRGGISIDPDQGYFGLHLETSPLVDRLHFRPNVEVGLGDDLTLVAVNMEFIYRFNARRQWRMYAGGGPALNIYKFDRSDDTNTEGGLNLLVGVENRNGLFFEVKVGAIDSPDVKFGVGYTWR